MIFFSIRGSLFASPILQYFGKMKDKLVEVHILRPWVDVKILCWTFREKRTCQSFFFPPFLLTSIPFLHPISVSHSEGNWETDKAKGREAKIYVGSEVKNEAGEKGEVN